MTQPELDELQKTRTVKQKPKVLVAVMVMMAMAVTLVCEDLPNLDIHLMTSFPGQPG